MHAHTAGLLGTTDMHCPHGLQYEVCAAYVIALNILHHYRGTDTHMLNAITGGVQAVQ